MTKINDEKFRKLTEDYINSEKKYFDTLYDYIGMSWNNEKLKRPLKILTPKAMLKLKVLDEKRLSLKKQWHENI